MLHGQPLTLLHPGVVGGLTQTPGWNRTFGTDTDANLLSTIVSIYEIGAAVGSVGKKRVCAALADI